MNLEMEPGLPNDMNFNKEGGGGGDKNNLPKTVFFIFRGCYVAL